jgi:hypothetical protein
MDQESAQTIPVLHAYRRDEWMFVWCQYCGEWHRHQLVEGYRPAPCQVPGSPYLASGYILEVIGEWPHQELPEDPVSGP